MGIRSVVEERYREQKRIQNIAKGLSRPATTVIEVASSASVDAVATSTISCEGTETIESLSAVMHGIRSSALTGAGVKELLFENKQVYHPYTSPDILACYYLHSK